LSLAGDYPEIKHPMLTPDLKELRIEAIADLHIGAVGFREKAFKEKVQEIVDSPNTLVVLDGDLINNSTKNSKGDVYEEVLNP